MWGFINLNLSALKNNLIIFSSTRKIREFKENFSSGIMPKTATLGEFFKKVIIVENLSECDEISRVMFMKQACEMTKNLNEKLHFPSEFFEFMKNSEYLFKFFKELLTHKKTIDDLRFSDTYAAYDEHLTILDELLGNYLRILRNNGVYDDISVCEIYKINENFIKEFDEITIYIDGFLSEFEFEIIEKSANFTNLKLIFKTSVLNKKMVEKISNLSKAEFEFGKNYTLNLSEKSIESCETLSKCQNILEKEFELRSLQCAFVFEKISSFIKSGISAKNIAVILPDEDFADILRFHDKENMLNFAMGIKFEKTIFFQLISKISQCINENKNIKFYENIYDDSVKKGLLDEFSFYFHEVGLKKDLFEKIKNKFFTQCEFGEFSEILYEIIELSKKDNLLLNSSLNELIAKPLFMLEKLSTKLNANSTDTKPTLKNLFEIFLIQSASIKIPHTGGGEVSVLGVLESRGMKFDGVIILDFNDDLVPSRSSAEMFLSSSVRKEAGLISHLDRENLQRFYYENLINSAQICAISYINDEEKIKSRFLKYFDTKKDENSWDYLGIFGEKTRKFEPKFDDEIIEKHDFFGQDLSFTMLDTYLKCKRKYYYKYVKKISEDSKFNEEDNTLAGNILHESFATFYEKNGKFDFEKFEEIYRKQAKNAGLSEFDILLNLHKVKKVADSFLLDHEKEFSCTKCEFEIKGREFNGITIEGKIDRIDENNKGEICVFDYKSGKKNDKSFQLAFYEILLDKPCDSKFIFFETGEICGVGKDFNKENLITLINELKNEFKNEVNFERTQKRGDCSYCPYKIICKGEI